MKYDVIEQDEKFVVSVYQEQKSYEWFTINVENDFGDINYSIKNENEDCQLTFI